MSSNKPIKMTFDDYDKFLELSEAVELKDKEPFWPTEEEIKTYSQKLNKQKFVQFLCWLLEKNGPPQNDEQNESRKAIKKYINKHLCIDD